jgi:hypothetical protein
MSTKMATDWERGSVRSVVIKAAGKLSIERQKRLSALRGWTWSIRL